MISASWPLVTSLCEYVFHLLHSMPVNETGFIENDNGKLVPSVGYDDEYGPDGKIKSRGRIDGLNGLTKLA